VTPVLDDTNTPLPDARGNAVQVETPASTEGRRRVLVVDDYTLSADSLCEQLESWGFEARAAYTVDQAMTVAEEFDPDLVVSDLVMPGADGIELLGRLREQGHDVEFLVLTGQGKVETAIEALQKGAFDYVAKPVDPQHLLHLLRRASERLESRRTMFRLRRVLENQGWYEDLVGDSPPMVELKRLIGQVASSAASVMITGESGTGKELVARTLHRLSPRDAQPFIPVNCAAIPENLLESELFGHEKGAFTGAIAARQGSFELANGGTLFLDEIAEMPVLLQAKLLRALEERSFRRVGGSTEVHVDVRVIAATNRDLEEAKNSGALREDLYYRLNVFHLHLPALRERGDDKITLAQRFIVLFAHREGKPVVGLDDATRDLIKDYAWPGNVRELRNAMERAVIVAHDALIAPENLPPAVRGKEEEVTIEPTVAAGMTVDEVERRLIFLTLEETGGNKTRAAKLLGISLKTLHNKLRRYKDEGLMATAGPEEAPALMVEADSPGEPS